MLKKASLVLLLLPFVFLLGCPSPTASAPVAVSLPAGQNWIPASADGDWGMLAGVAGYAQFWVSSITITDGKYSGSKLSYDQNGTLYIKDGTQAVPFNWTGSAIVSAGKTLTKK